jgi:hypothetical protein
VAGTAVTVDSKPIRPIAESPTRASNDADLLAIEAKAVAMLGRSFRTNRRRTVSMHAARRALPFT